MFANRYASRCSNPICKTYVEIGEGFTQKVIGRYQTWCRSCVPARIPAPAAPKVRVLTIDGKIIMPYEKENIPLLRSMPGARWNPTEKCWTVSLAMADRARVLELADKIGLEVPPSLKQIEKTEQAEQATAAGLYEFQVDGVNFLSHKQKALLGDEMGLGKSVQSLMSIPKNGAALVICRACLKYNWKDEVARWRPDLTPVVLNGRDSFRWAGQNEVVIINNDILPDSFNTPSKNHGENQTAYWTRLAQWRQSLKQSNPQAASNFCIIDEAHDYKNKKAARTRKVREIAKLTAKTIGLTGSPLTNRPEDLFNVLDTIGLAKDVFGNFEKFQKLFHAHHNGYGWQYGSPDPIVPELLRRVMLRRLRAEVLPELPAKTYTNMLVNCDNKELNKKLDSLWGEFKDMLEVGTLPPFRQFSEIRADLAHSRIPAMLDFVENHEEQEVPLVVFSKHLSPLDALIGRDGWAVITGDTHAEKRQEIVRAFQAGQLKGVGISIAAGGVGLTLTRAWKVLFVDLDWTPASNWQAEDRVARIGQRSNRVEIVRMVSDHVLDLHVQKLLVEKIQVINESIDASMTGVKHDAPKVGESVVQEAETEAQYEERMKKLLEQQAQAESMKAEQEKEAFRQYAKTRVDGIHKRETARSSSRLLPMTTERATAIRHAFTYMLSVCDGAASLDNVGFNKPDASVAHLLLSAGLETEKELEAGYCILKRYHRQLSDKYPLLFQKVAVA